MKALVTGSGGSIGRVLVERLRELEHPVHPFDIADDWRQDILTDAVDHAVRFFQPDVVFHLAAWKLAPEGELNPFKCSQVNIAGTESVLLAAELAGAKVIMTSTCKACDPETAYGASKLIAERMVLNAGGTVVRFYNIPEADNNVFRLWESLPEDAPIPYTDCWRYFVSMEESVALLLSAPDLPPGRYAPLPPILKSMADVARETYPDRQHVRIPHRRGDRWEEPARAKDEQFELAGSSVVRIASPHDSAAFLEVPAAA